MIRLIFYLRLALLYLPCSTIDNALEMLHGAAFLVFAHRILCRNLVPPLNVRLVNLLFDSLLDGLGEGRVLLDSSVLLSSFDGPCAVALPLVKTATVVLLGRHELAG